MSSAALALIQAGNTITAASIMSATQLQQIRLTVTETQSMLVAWYCRDNGSSPNLTAPPGNIEGTTTWKSVFQAIRAVCSLRQHNAYYATWVEFHSRAMDDAPHDFIGKGYSTATRFVAFDFAHGLSSPHSYRDQQIIKLPSLSEAEMAAINANATVKIFNSRQQGATTSTNLVEVLGGRVNAGQAARLALPPPV